MLAACHPCTPLPCTFLPEQIFPLVIFIAKHERSQPSSMAGVMRCCSLCLAATQSLRCPWAPKGAPLISAWELHLWGMNLDPLKEEKCCTHLHASQGFCGFVWRHPLCFFPLISVWHWKLFVKSWRDYCSCFPSLEWVAWCICILPGRMDCGFKVFFVVDLHQFYSNRYALSPLLAPSYKLFTPRCSAVTL